MPFTIVRDDLAHMRADAVVLPSNEHLIIDGGTGLAVGKKAGLWRLRRACKRIGHCPTGGAVHTRAYSFPARYLIHAVGPIWGEDPEHDEDLLRSAYDAALSLAVELECESVALPLLSAGTYGCPAETSLALALDSISAALEEHELDVTLVLYDRKAVVAGLEEFDDIVSFIDDCYVEEQRRLEVQRRTEGRWRLEQEWPQDSDYADNYCSGLSTDDGPSPSSAMPPAPSSGYARLAGPPPQPRSAAGPSGWLGGLMGTSDSYAPAAEEEYAPAPQAQASMRPDNLKAWLSNLDEGFSATLLKLIDARGLKDSEVYKSANISRQHFSKIRNDPSYRPTKKTALALAIALELDLDETSDLLSRAGLAMSKADKFDMIVEFYIRRGMYDIMRINEALYSFDQPLLG